jgi:hypothetical protein
MVPALDLAALRSAPVPKCSARSNLRRCDTSRLHHELYTRSSSETPGNHIRWIWSFSAAEGMSLKTCLKFQPLAYA